MKFIKQEEPDVQVVEAEGWLDYGAIEIKMAIEPRELDKSEELKRIFMKYFIRRYYTKIKYLSYEDKYGYNPDWIQEMFYNQMQVLVDKKVIQKCLKEVRV